VSSYETHFLHRFFHPRSVAVVGVSRDPGNINHHLVSNLVNLGFRGDIYPVHHLATEILGLRAYPSISSIDGPVDLAVVALPNTMVLPVLKECVQKGVSRVVIVAGGFSEAGEKGRRTQTEMARLLRENNIRAIGPNALSPINTAENLAISFHPLTEIKRGGLSLIFQSGLYEPRLHWLLSEFGLRLNKLIDLGNKMDVNEVDALGYLAADPETHVIGIHLESIEGSGREFLRLIREASREKHVVILKSGRTEAGARAAATHTGVMVQGSDLVFDAAVRQAGAIRAQTIEEFFDLVRALERFGPLLMRGSRIVIATLPGGEAVILTDLCQQEGLSPARIGQETLERLRPIFPPWEIPGNPFDIGVCVQFNDGQKVYGTLVDSMSRDPEVDGIAMQFPSAVLELLPEEMLQVFPSAVEGRKVPIVIWAVGLKRQGSRNVQWLEDRHVPIFPCPEKALKALSALCRSSRFKISLDQGELQATDHGG
jgi:acyl-CoA synthetase (NDP forming)